MPTTERDLIRSKGKLSLIEVWGERLDGRFTYLGECDTAREADAIKAKNIDAYRSFPTYEVRFLGADPGRLQHPEGERA